MAVVSVKTHGHELRAEQSYTVSGYTRDSTSSALNSPNQVMISKALFKNDLLRFWGTKERH